MKRRSESLQTFAGVNARRAPAYGLTLAIALSCFAPAGAQIHAGGAMANFRTIDTDRDARLDRRELTAAADRDFNRLDVDHDGYLTRSELAQTRNTSLFLPFPGRLNSERSFMAADTDRDRKIDRHEYEHAVVQAYMRCDRNRDNTIEVRDLRHCGM